MPLGGTDRSSWYDLTLADEPEPARYTVRLWLKNKEDAALHHGIFKVGADA
jgi:hypothetical protein